MGRRAGERASLAAFLFFYPHMKHLSILTALLLTLALASCGEDEEGSPVFITARIPAGATVYSNTYEKITVEATSTGAQLSRFGVSSFDALRGNVVLLDSLIGGTALSCDFLYKVPMLAQDSVKVKLTFTVAAADGFEQRVTRQLTVVQREYKLEEVAGLTLYATEGGDHPNALRLADLRPLVASLADSADIDLYTHLDESDPETLSREWRTQTDVYFARANQFDYANATNHSVSEAFGSAVANPRIKNIQKNDIILVGRGNQAVAAIKVAQLYDETGADNDRYILNIKKIK